MTRVTKRYNIDEKTLKENEIDANKGIARGCLTASIIVAIAWIFYLTGVFKIANRLLFVISIVFPLVIVALGSMFFLKFTKIIEKGIFKHIVISVFLGSIFVLHTFLPRHTLILYASAIVLINHYYNPRIAMWTFIACVLMFLVSTYLGMFFGDWDPHTLSGIGEPIIIDGVVVKTSEATVSQRIEWLRILRERGDNRYVTTFVYYFLPRACQLGLIYYICYTLSIRTSKLLFNEATEIRRNERLLVDLNSAREIQIGVLPHNDKTNKKVYGLMNAAKEVGGDFYDFFNIDETHIAYVIADVSGKGMSGALLMMKTETLIKSLANTIKTDTSYIMTNCNKIICAKNDKNMFVTCWLGILDTSTGELKFTNAGHNPPIIVRKGEVSLLKDKPNLVLGAIDDAPYTEKTIKLNKGDRLLLYTDGVTETPNRDKELFGDYRLINFIKENKDSEIRDLIIKIRAEVKNFQDGEEQFDDITMLMFEY